MIFPDLIREEVLQIGDKTRLFIGESFATPEEGAITKAEISFDNITYTDVFKSDMPEKWYLDYAFGTDGEKTIYVKITTETNDSTESFTMTVISEEDDKLFSNDAQLFAEETEMKDFFPKGKNSFKYAHRVSQRNIVRYLDGEGIVDINKKPFTKDELVLNEYISEWSIYETLMNIFEDMKVRDKELFEKKKIYYSSKLTKARKNAKIRLDYNKDGEIKDTEIKNVQNKFLTR